MKSAYLLAKTPTFFKAFGHHLKGLKYDYDEAVNSIKLKLEGDAYFMFYDRLNGGFFEECEIPPDAKSMGFCYAFLVECRSEVDFCRIVGSSPSTLDFLVCDGSETLYHPNEISPDSIVL